MFLKILSDADILDKSRGQVLSARKYTKDCAPIEDGLFCQRIFGPVVSYVCACGHERPDLAGEACPDCDVEYTTKRKRREWFGHINLPFKIVHPLFVEALGKAVGLSRHKMKRVLTEEASLEFKGSASGKGTLKLDISDRDDIPLTSMEDFYKMTGAISKKAQQFFVSKIVVIPADHRPMTQIGERDERPHTITAHYEVLLGRIRIINKLLERQAILPSSIEHRMERLLQSTVDGIFVKGLYDNMNNEIPSILNGLKSKDGFIRGAMLGKRVDFSARTVLGGEPTTDIETMKLPRSMAYTLFEPWVIRRLVETGSTTLRSAFRAYREGASIAHEALDDIIPHQWVFVNRAPSLHKASVVGLKVEITENKCLALPHYIFAGMGADSDGDTISVHVPMGSEAYCEVRDILSPAANLRNQANGAPAYLPSHECLGGLYYTTDLQGTPVKTIFRSITELELARANSYIKINTPIMWKDVGDPAYETCLGRKLIEQECGIRVDAHFGKKEIEDYVRTMIDTQDPHDVLAHLTYMEKLGYEEITIAGPSIALKDLHPPKERDAIFAEAEKREALVVSTGKQNVLDRHAIWEEAFSEVFDIWKNTGEATISNPARFFSIAAGRLSDTQVRQLSVAKGRQADYAGEPISYIIKGNLTDGLSIADYMGSMSGARASHIAKIDATPKSGYMARKLVQAGRDLYITQEDCESEDTLEVEDGYGRYDKDGCLILEHGSATVRTPIFCTAKKGICQKCYGAVGHHDNIVSIGIAVGVCAGQSFAEKSTQASMKRKHDGGAAGTNAAQGIDYIEDLIEYRTRIKPKIRNTWPENVIDMYNALEGTMGRSLASQHYEMIVRSMSELVPSGKSFKLRSLSGGEPILAGVTSILRRHPSWLRAIGFGYVKETLIRAVLNDDIETQGVPSERIYTGERITR